MKNGFIQNKVIKITVTVLLVIVFAGMALLVDRFRRYDVTGTVIDHEGKAMSSILVSGGDRRARTDRDGNWEITNLRGTVLLQARDNMREWEFSPSSVTVRKGSSDITFSGKYKISGKVLDAAGNGIGGVTFHLSGESSDVVSDPNGTWVISGLTKNETTSLYKPGYTFFPQVVSVNGPEEFVIEGGYTVTGRAVDHSGQGLSDLIIDFSGGFGTAVTDSEGWWEKSGLSGESVCLSPRENGMYSFVPSSIEVNPSTDNVHFQGFFYSLG